ncbi:MAG: polysaccharide biosynthesis protein [Clostridiales bacterium]|jgi:FlaA1/EpsC-like NDP-sugar epimerase|nr:polysaccharide biosynthesis protein [Clostridiales bacterium]
MERKEKQKPGRHDAKTTVILLLLDIAFAVFAFWIAREIIFFQIDLKEAGQYLAFELPIAVASVVVTVVMFVIFDCYNVIWKYAGRVEFFKFMFACLVDFLALAVLKLIFRTVVDVEFWIPQILMYLLFSALLSGLTRFSGGLLRYIRHVGYIVDERVLPGVKRTLVVGAGYTGSLVINRFINNPNEGYYPVAVLDDDPHKQGKRIYGVNVEGGLDVIGDVVKNRKVDTIVIAIMNVSKSQLKRIYTKCSPFNLPIKIMPAITNAEQLSNNVVSLRDIKIEELLGRDEFTLKKELIDLAVRDKTVLVTGGAGSIGSELCRQALLFGCKRLIIFDQHENGMFFLGNELAASYGPDRYTQVMGTVREKDKLKEVFAAYRPDIVFHAAAYKHVPMMEISATEAIKNNVFGTLNVIECANDAGTDKLVLISTDKAVNPSNIMGASKRIAEMLIETRGKRFTTKMAAVRFGNVLGSNGSVIPIFLKQIKAGGPITLTDRNIMRYFMSIPEAVRLVLQTGAMAESGEIFVLDMGDPVYIYDLACDLIRINGLVPNEDIEIKITGLRPGEKMFEELRYDNEAVDRTAHEGVFVNKMEAPDEKRFEKQLAELGRCAFSEDDERTAEVIFEIVPSPFRQQKKSRPKAAAGHRGRLAAPVERQEESQIARG